MRRVVQGVLLATLLLPAGCCAPGTCTPDGVRLLDPIPIDKPITSPPIPPGPAATPGIRTVLDPDAPPRNISLAECIALALENGRVNDESIRVLAYDPAIAGTEIEQALARFDARLVSDMRWLYTDQQQGTAQQLALSNRPFEKTDRTELSTQLQKPLPTGGLAGITYQHNYQLSNLQESAPGAFNPSHQPAVVFNFEQPLLQGYGVEINQLRTAHPSAQGGRGSSQGILLARVAFDQSRAEFERRVQDLVANVEEAYWNLYCSYWILYSRETALRQVYQEWLLGSYQFKERRFTIQSLAQVEEQYQLFRGERLAALGNGLGQPGVLEAERLLRLAIGLPPEDGCRLVPSDTPTVAPYRPDWKVAVEQALALRPDLVRARQEVKAAQLSLIRERNDLLPDLRFISSYNVNALGSRLDGAGPENAYRTLGSNTFNNWSLGLRMEVPLGRREAHAAVRRAQLQLARQLALLRNQEELAVFELQRSYRQLLQSAEQIRIQRARRAAAARQLQAQLELFRVGASVPDQNQQPLVLLVLTAQRNLADALRDEQSAICEYNIALARFERDKGTLLIHDNVSIVEGPLPSCVMERASDNLRKQQAGLTLRRRAAPDVKADKDPLLHVGVDEPVPLPELLEQPKPPAELPPRPTELPPPRPVEQPARASEPSLLTPPPPVPRR